MEEREILGWITVNGNHVPVYKGESPSMATKRFLREKSNTDKVVEKDRKEKERSIEQNKKEAEKLNKEEAKKSLPKRAPLPNISVKEANRRSDILDLGTKKRYKFVSDVTDVYAFCGKGSSKEFRDASKYAKRYGGKAEDWQHCAGRATISNGKVTANAEIHWVQLEGGNIREAFVKFWED